MTPRRVGYASLLLLGSASSLPAQTAPASASAPAPLQASPTPATATNGSRIVDPYTRYYATSRPHPYRSRTAPQPPATDPDSEYGFRNPGGVGRTGEFYPPGNTFASGGRDPVRVAGFDQGNADTSRQAQLQAQQLGNAKNRTMLQHIDAYGAPRIGYGFGFGYGLGGAYPY